MHEKLFIITECAMTLTNSYGLIISPVGPVGPYYYNNIDCTWLIQRNNGEQIELNFIFFSVACCGNYG